MFDVTYDYNEAGYIGHVNLSTCIYYNNSVLVRHCIAEKKFEAFSMSLVFWIPISFIVLLAFALGLFLFLRIAFVFYQTPTIAQLKRPRLKIRAWLPSTTNVTKISQEENQCEYYHPSLLVQWA